MITKESVNTFSTLVKQDGNKLYTEIGNGINYQKDDGTFAEANPAIVSSARTGIDYECYTTYNRVGFKSDISTGSFSIFSQIGNTGKILKSKPVGIAYLNASTKDYTFITTLQSSTGVVNGNTITYSDAFQNCDLEYVIEKGHLKQNLIIKSKVGFPASPYPASDTWVVVVTKFDLANYELPMLTGDAETDTPYDGTNPIETDIGQFKFSDQAFTLGEATDNNGSSMSVKKRLINVSGNHYLLEGVPYSFLASAAYPVLLDYTTVSGTIGSDTTWNAGTYYISSTVTVSSGVTLTIAAGQIIKGASGASLTIAGTLTVNGTSASPVYFTSMNDDSVGDSITGSTGTPAAGDWDGVRPSGNCTFTVTFSSFSYGSLGLNTVGNFVGSDISDSSFHHNSTYGLALGAAQSSGTRVCTRCESYSNTTGFNISNGNNAVSKFQDCYSHDNSSYGFALARISGDCYAQIFNCLITSNGAAGINANSTAVHPTIKNSTIDSNGGNGVIIGGAFSTGSVIDSIISNNGGWGVSGGTSVTYCDLYNNTSGSTTGVGTTANNITTDPAFQTGAIISGFTGLSANYFLNQSTSPAKDAGSDTAATEGYDTYTTATDATTDSGTVDMGFHYIVDRVSVAVSDLSINISDSITLTESKTVSLVNFINVNSPITLSESVSAFIYYPVNVNDSITSTENIVLLDTLNINVNDGITVSDVNFQTQVYNINKNESITVSENYILLETSFINVNNTITVSENETVDLVFLINANDNITISENLILEDILNINVNENITVNESTTIVPSSTGGFFVSDDITVSENINIIIDRLLINVNDSISVNENIIILESHNINVNDSIIVSENLILVPQLVIIISDSIIVNENVTLTPLIININCNDSIIISENMSFINNLNLSISDIIVTDDNQIVLSVNIPGINVSDSITVNEFINLNIPGQIFLVNVYEAISISESTTIDRSLIKLILVKFTSQINKNIAFTSQINNEIKFSSKFNE